MDSDVPFSEQDTSLQHEAVASIHDILHNTIL